MKKFLIVLLCFLLIICPACNVQEQAAVSSDEQKQNREASLPDTPSKASSTMVENNHKKYVADTYNNKYFTPDMPPLTPEEEAMVDLPVPDEIRSEFENYICYPHGKLGETFTYGELWRYIGVDGEVNINEKNIGIEAPAGNIHKVTSLSILPHLKSIKKLSVIPFSHIDKSEIEGIGKMIWLEELNVQGYLMIGTLEELPCGFRNLSNLKKLNISFNEFIELPDIFYEFENLEELDLDWCFIEKLPPSLFRLKNLKTLRLRQNELTKIPNEINQLSDLEVLWLDGNSFVSIPDEICELSNLRELRIGFINEKKYRLREDYPLSKMANRLPDNFGNLTALETLYIYDFPIKHLPYSFGNLTNLKYLQISLPLEDLPESFSKLNQLEYLNFSNIDYPDTKKYDSTFISNLAKEMLGKQR